MKRLLLLASVTLFASAGFADVEALHLPPTRPAAQPAPAADAAAPAAPAAKPAGAHHKKPAKHHSKKHHEKKSAAPESKQGT